MVVLLLIISLIAIGSNVVYKDNIATVIAHIDNMEGESLATTTIKFPKGFTKDNCTIINISHKENDNTDYQTNIDEASVLASITVMPGWSDYSGDHPDEMFITIYPRDLNLGDTTFIGINSIDIKITLIKIN